MRWIDERYIRSFRFSSIELTDGRIALRRRGIMLPEATRRRRRILQSGASPSRIEGYREFEADLSALFFWRFLAEIEFSQIKTK